MTQKRTGVKKEALAKAAAMFEVTTMSEGELSAAASLVSDKTGNALDNIIENAEIEKMHEEEISEAKSLGIDEPIIESTNSEMIRSLNNEIDSAREEIANLLCERDALMRQISGFVSRENEISKKFEDLKRENNRLSGEVLALSSKLDLNRTDSSREITDYKIEIQDLQEKIEMYERNESNYKFDITKLKSEIANLETSLAKANATGDRAATPQAAPSGNRLGKRIVPMYSAAPDRPATANGYTSWN